MTIPALLKRRQTYLPPERGGGVQDQVVSGSAWSAISIAATTGIRMLRSVVFARLLMPEDFGMLALAMIFTQFVLIFANFGLNASIIYQKTLDRKDLNTCWWTNFLVDGVIAVICCAAALAGQEYFGIGDGAWIVCLLAVQFVFEALGSINRALMRRLFMFKKIAMVQIATALSAALGGVFFITVVPWGIYGLVTGLIIGTIVRTALYFAWLPWLPSLTFSRDRIRGHLSYGGWFLGVHIVTFINGNIGRTLVGTRLDTAQLGYYEYAGNIPQTVAMQLSQAITSVLFPAFSSLQDDFDRLADLLRKVYRYNALIIYPLLAGLGLVAGDLVLVLYGEKWAPVIPLMQGFCLAGMVGVVTNPLFALCQGTGVPRLPFKWMLIILPFNVAALWLSIENFGAMGAIGVRIATPIILLLTLGIEIFRHTRFRLRWLVQSLWPGLACSVLMAACVLGAQMLLPVDAMPRLVRLLVEITVGALSYLGAVVVFFRHDARALSSRGLRFLKSG